MQIPDDYVTRAQLEAVTKELIKISQDTKISAKERINAAISVYTARDRWTRHFLEAAMVETVSDVADGANKNASALDKLRKLEEKRDRKPWESDPEDEEE